MIILRTVLILLAGIGSVITMASVNVDTTINAVHDKLRSGHEFFLIDVRELGEWQEGRINKAKLIPRSQIKDKISSVVPKKNSEVVLYCASGGRSTMAAHTLMSLGYTNVKSMSGGINAWLQAGLPIEK